MPGDSSLSGFNLRERVLAVVEQVVTDNLPLDGWLVLDVSSSLLGEPFGRPHEARTAAATRGVTPERAGRRPLTEGVIPEGTPWTCLPSRERAV